MALLTTGCAKHNYCVMPDGHEYHAYLYDDTELIVTNDIDGNHREIKWNTKKSPTALDNVVAVTSVALANSITHGD